MAQFDVHRFKGAASGVRYVVDIQSDLLHDLATRLVAPAYRVTPATQSMTRLNPILDIAGAPHLLAMQEMAAVRRSSLGAVAGSVAAERDAIIAVIDLLVTGI